VVPPSPAGKFPNKLVRDDPARGDFGAMRIGSMSSKSITTKDRAARPLGVHVRQGCFYSVEGLKSTLVAGFRPRTVKLPWFLRWRNREDGGSPAACWAEGLIRGLCGAGEVDGAKGTLARIVFERFRRVAIRSNRPCLLETVSGRGSIRRGRVRRE
jgi:hypothetical protein